jgi:peptide/nickel transport system substrate-binding protein
MTEMVLTQRTVKRLKFLGSFLGVFLVIGTLVEALGSVTWHLSPRDPAAIEEASRFQGVLGSLVKSPEDGMASPFSSRKPALAREGERQPVGLHRVAEWPASQGRNFHESPKLKKIVDRGDLPPVVDRLPVDPLVIVPPQQIGPYGGTWTRLANGPKDIGVVESRFSYDGLVRWGPMANTILPNLATHWTVEDNAKTFTFWLRKGVRWSDGYPFTAEDIEFWHEDVLKNAEITPVVPRDFKREGQVLSFEKVDDYTVRFRFASPNGLFLKAMATGRGYEMVRHAKHYMKNFHPRYVSVDTLEAMALARGFDLWSKLFDDTWGWRTIGTPRLWPWILKDPPPARPAVLVRNPYYWKVDPEGNQLPYIDRMTFDIYDAETINFKAINGEMGMQSRHLELQNYPLFMENREKGGYRVNHWIDPSMGYNAIGLNLNHPDSVMKKIIHDRRFRIALSHAINRDELNEADYFGKATPRQAAPLPTSPYYSEGLEKAYLTYDPELANRILDEMCLVEKNSDGQRLRPDGSPIVIRLETTSLNNRVLELVSGYWTSVGVQTEIKEEARQLFYERKRGLLHDGAIWGAGNGQSPLVDPRNHVPFSDESIYAVDYARWFRTDGKRGDTPPDDIVQCIELYREIERTADEAEQVRLYKEILELNRKNLWVIGTVGEMPAIFVVRNDFRNVPDVAMSGWIFRAPGNTAMECYAIDPSGAN